MGDDLGRRVRRLSGEGGSLQSQESATGTGAPPYRVQTGGAPDQGRRKAGTPTLPSAEARTRIRPRPFFQAPAYPPRRQT